MDDLRRLRPDSRTFENTPMKKSEPSSKVQVITRAMKRVAKEARCMAKMHGILIWVKVNGKVVGLKP